MAKIIIFPESSAKTPLALSCARQEVALTLETVRKIEPILVLLKHIQAPIFSELELEQLNTALKQIASILQERNLGLRSVLEAL